jgi:hypothetical protein
VWSMRNATNILYSLPNDYKNSFYQLVFPLL